MAERLKGGRARALWLVAVWLLMACSSAGAGRVETPAVEVVQARPTGADAPAPVAAEVQDAGVFDDMDLVIAFEGPRGMIEGAGLNWVKRSPQLRSFSVYQYQGAAVELAPVSVLDRQPAAVASRKAGLDHVDWANAAVEVGEQELCWPELRDAVSLLAPERVLLGLRGKLTERGLACLRALGPRRLYIAGCRYHDFIDNRSCDGDQQVAALAADEVLRLRVRGLAFSLNKAHTLQALARFPELRHLAIVDGSKPQPDARFERLPFTALRQLRYLHINRWRKPINELTAPALHMLGQLHTLSWFFPRASRPLAHCKLRRLVTPLDDEPMAALFAACAHLSELYTRIEHGLTIASSLQQWPQLERLQLDGWQRPDFPPLQPLTKLRALRMTEVKLRDYRPLASLTQLEVLNLSQSSLPELTPVAKLTKLRVLNVEGAPVSDLAPLAALTSLEQLWLADTQVGDLGPIASLPRLDFVNLSGTQVRDISLLADHPALAQLHLAASRVTDIRATFSMPKLEVLNVSGLTLPAAQVRRARQRLGWSLVGP